jgi:tRNA pseudouridine55 synthase
MIIDALKNISLEEGAILLIDKPLRWTSFDVINKIKYEIRKNTGNNKFKIGHAGTLDPLATGLLIVCVGKYTKKISEFQNLTKQYIGTFTIGATTKSCDLEYPPENFKPYDNITLPKIIETAKLLKGTYFQTPPIFSAVKIKGKSAFEYAREDKDIVIMPKEITVSSFEILHYSPPEIDFEICCSKGTYIRSIANDFGNILGCGAYLTSLCRTKIGDFNINDAFDLSPLLTEKKLDTSYRKKKKFEL